MPFSSLPLEFSTLSIALVGACAYGGGDFMGGRAAVRLSAPGAVALAQIAAMLVTARLHLDNDGGAIGGAILVPGLLGGFAYAVGLMFLYRGIAYGRIGVVAPVCGIVGILLPLAGDVALARTIESPQLLGIAICALAIVLLSRTPERDGGVHRVRWSFRIGVISGLGYGSADLLLGMMAPEEASGGLMVARSTAAFIAVAMLAGAVASGRAVAAALPVLGAAPRAASTSGPGATSLVPLLPALGLATVAGVFDALGHVSYVHVATQGSMAVASALVALFPAVAVLLAVLVLRERIVGIQYLGLAASGAGVFVICL